MKAIIFFLGSLFLLSSCSSVKFYSDSTLKTETGIKMYSAKPYLLVDHTKSVSKTTSSDTLLTEIRIIYLPDLRHPIYVKQTPGIGTSDLKLTLSNGVLTTYGLTTDTKIPDIITASTGLISGLAAAEKNVEKAKEQNNEPPEKIAKSYFELYEFIVDKDNTIKLQRVEIK
jgi:hypothetical protein